MKKLAALALALAAAAPLAACNHPPPSFVVHAAPGDKDTALTATGSFTMNVSPDCADLTLTIQSDAGKPAAAIAEARKQEDKLVAALKKAGVADADLTLSTIGVDPNYRYDGNRTILDGFQAHVTITATTRAFDQIGALMETAADNGVTQMSSRFRRSDLEAIRKQVREQALKNAQDKAKDTASTLGLRLGRITAVADASQSYLYTSEYFPSAADSGAVALGGETQPITVEVTLTYEI
jgi:uncharacterized protein YggE